jgi:hypothetical protein
LLRAQIIRVDFGNTHCNSPYRDSGMVAEMYATSGSKIYHLRASASR